MIKVFSVLAVTVCNIKSSHATRLLASIILCLGMLNQLHAQDWYTAFVPPTAQQALGLKPIICGAQRLDLLLPLIKGRRIAIVANQSSILPSGINITDTLLKLNQKIIRVFSPEHGFRGTADAGEKVDNYIDTKTGLKVLSLYGANKQPTPQQLDSIDIMLFDLQDVGVRFYTYLGTMELVMKACQQQKIIFVVLDRPNPLGYVVDGPILDTTFRSFVGMQPVPVMHGLTAAEYAQMLVATNYGEATALNPSPATLDLKIVPLLNYDRSCHYDLPVRPSPNLGSAGAVAWYASLCLFEGTPISVGRGTATAFLQYGAPAKTYGSHTFTPRPNPGAKDPLYSNKMCYGETVETALWPCALDILPLVSMYHKTKDTSAFFKPFFTKLAGTKVLQQQIMAGTTATAIRASWQPALATFRQRSKPWLLYR